MKLKRKKKKEKKAKQKKEKMPSSSGLIYWASYNRCIFQLIQEAWTLFRVTISTSNYFLEPPNPTTTPSVPIQEKAKEQKRTGKREKRKELQ
jgi:hypothetical protein